MPSIPCPKDTFGGTVGVGCLGGRAEGSGYASAWVGMTSMGGVEAGEYV